MTRPIRIEYPNAWYHVMNSGRRNEDIFLKEDDHSFFIKVLKETSKIYKVEIAAFCLLRHQYQILIKTPRANLSAFMRQISSVYTQTFNRRYSFSGAIFKGRYEAVLIEEGDRLLDVMKYLHRLPLRDGKVGKLASYPWTSHHEYISSSADYEWLQKGKLLSMFSKDKVEQRQKYYEFLQKSDSIEILKFYEKQKAGSVYGSEIFQKKVSEGSLAIQEHSVDSTSCKCSQISSRTVSEFSEFLCKRFQIPATLLLHSQRGKENVARDTAIYLTRLHCDESLYEIGLFFGLNSPSSVSSAIQRIETKKETDVGVKQMLQDIEYELSIDDY